MKIGVKCVRFSQIRVIYCTTHASSCRLLKPKRRIIKKSTVRDIEKNFQKTYEIFKEFYSDDYPNTKTVKSWLDVIEKEKRFVILVIRITRY